MCSQPTQIARKTRNSSKGEMGCSQKHWRQQHSKSESWFLDMPGAVKFLRQEPMGVQGNAIVCHKELLGSRSAEGSGSRIYNGLVC